MIRDTKLFATEVEAQKHGEEFMQGWGYGYGASFQVYYSELFCEWACYTTRYSSCD
jgi:hypothetical protein